MIQEEEISFDEIEKILKKRNLEFFKDEIYIMPEASEENSDILNEYTPDIHKFLKLHGIKSIIVKKENHSYLALRDDSIILPLIVGISSSIIANFLYDWIKNNFKDQSVIKLKFISKKKNGKLVKIKFEGTKKELKQVLKQLEDI